MVSPYRSGSKGWRKTSVSIPYAQDVRPRKISIDVGDSQRQIEARNAGTSGSER